MTKSTFTANENIFVENWNVPFSSQTSKETTFGDSFGFLLLLAFDC